MVHYYTTRRRWLLAFLTTSGLLAATAAQAQTTKIEAENPANTLTGSGIAVVTAVTGFTGTGYVDFNGKPTSLTIPYSATTAGAYDLLIRYESQYDFKVGKIAINGAAAVPIYFNSTKTGSPFRSTSKLRVTLQTGANNIVISDGDYGYFGIDYIQLTPAPAVTALTPTAAGRIEAELGTLTNTQALVRDDDTGTHSGDTYVSNGPNGLAANSIITLPINVATAGVYQVTVGARGIYGAKSFDTSVGPGTTASTSKLTTQVPTVNATFQPYVVGNYNMVAGANTIAISTQTGYLEVDYVDIMATTAIPTAARASAEAQRALTAYPNPTNGQALTVGLELVTAQQTTFDLVNALGQRVSTTTRALRAGSNQLQLPTAGVSAGLYQLVVHSGDQPLLVQRVLVN